MSRLTQDDFRENLEKLDSFSTGKSFQLGWKFVKKTYWNMMGYMIVLFLIIGAISALFGVIASEVTAVSFVGNLVNQALVTLLMAGIFRFMGNGYKSDMKFTFGDFFGGFSSAGQLLLYALVILLFSLPIIGVVIALGFPLDYFTGGFDPMTFTSGFTGGRFLGAILIGFVLYAFLGMVYSFAVPFLMNYDVGFWTAMELSRKIVFKHFFPLLGYYILLFLLLIGLYVGAALLMVLFAMIPILGIVIIFVGVLFLGTLLFTIWKSMVFSAFVQLVPQQYDSFQDQIDTFGEAQRDINSENQENDISPSV